MLTKKDLQEYIQKSFDEFLSINDLNVNKEKVIDYMYRHLKRIYNLESIDINQVNKLGLIKMGLREYCG